MLNNSMLYARLVLLSLFVFALTSCSSQPKTASSSIFVLMQTSHGAIHIELYADKAPVSVANFLSYVDAGAYRGGEFYRVVRHDNDKGKPKITVIQGRADRAFVEFAPIELETTKHTGVKHLDGTLSMARLGPSTATMEFFICVGPQPALDFGGKRHGDGQGFAAFGRVVAGMDVVRRINQSKEAQATDDPYLADQILANPVIIESITRL